MTYDSTNVETNNQNNTQNVSNVIDIPTVQFNDLIENLENNETLKNNSKVSTDSVDEILNLDNGNEAFLPESLPANFPNKTACENSENSSYVFDNFKFPEIKDEKVDEFSLLTASTLNGSVEDNGRINENCMINNLSSLQKQHLQQMATDVENVLTENENSSEIPTISSDLKGKNEFLTACLEEQKRLVNQLHVKVSQYSSRVSELEALLSTKDIEHKTNLLREINPLKEQLQIHAQTTGILVAEKTELTSAITKYETLARKKTEQVDELCRKLKNSQSQISELEKEQLKMKKSVDDMEKMYQQMQSDYQHLDKKYTELKKDRDEQQMEIAELRQDVNLKNTELSNLHREYEEKNNLLSLAELKIQQLTNTPQENQTLEGKHQAESVLEQQILQLHEALKSVNTEKEEGCKHYENYVKQLDARYEKLVEELESSKCEIEELKKQEESFIQRLSVMEQQYQQEKQKAETLKHLEAHADKVSQLTESIDVLVVEKDKLELKLQEKDTEIEKITGELQELRELGEESVDTSKLVTALESEQLGASRAVLQNQQLKSQLSEMHDAFVTLSNSKLDLTEKLQGERVIGKKLNAQLNKVEAERDELKDELKKKESVLEELEKEKLQSAQITDQMQHYQAQSTYATTLQTELQNALTTIECLKKENQMLNNTLMNNDGCPDEGVVENVINIDDNSIEVGVDIGAMKKETKESEVQTNENNADFVINSMDPEPVKKLEVRFKETMEKVAELTDEKQKLEHLVLQLQGETETIGK